MDSSVELPEPPKPDCESLCDLETEPVEVIFEPVINKKNLIREVEKKVEEIRLRYKNRREQLRKEEAKEIENFYEKVYDGFNASPPTKFCAIN